MLAEHLRTGRSVRRVRTNRRTAVVVVAGLLAGAGAAMAPLVPAGAAVPPAGVINTVAGTTVVTGAAALTVSMHPVGLVLDSFNNEYIASGNSVLTLNSTTGKIDTYAGNGTAGRSGDGSAATAAQLTSPSGLAVDSNNNLYIADTGNHQVRKVDTSGVITLVAGTGTAGYTGDAGPATAATLQDPMGVAVDSAGNVFISDTGNNVIRRVDVTTGDISTYAGTGAPGLAGDGGPAASATLSAPHQIDLDSAANLYIADTGNNVIRKVLSTTGIISTIAGTGIAGSGGDGGPATSAKLNAPQGVAAGGSGNVFIGDTGNNALRHIVPNVGIIRTVGGGGNAGAAGDGAVGINASTAGPTHVDTDSGNNLYFADTDNNVVRKIAFQTNVISRVAGSRLRATSGDGADALLAQLDTPSRLSVDYTGDYYFVEPAYALPAYGPDAFTGGRIRKVSASTGQVSTVAGDGTYGYGGDGGNATAAQLADPHDVVVDPYGNLLIADFGNNLVRRVISGTGKIDTYAGTGAPGSSGDSGDAKAADITGPDGLAVDSSGNLFLASVAEAKVRRVDAVTGVITTVAGDGTAAHAGDGGAATAASVDGPSDVAVASNGDLYIVESNGLRVRKVTAGTGIISTVAGTGVAGSTGDGGAATAATFQHLSAIALDGAGQLYLADAGAHKVRKVATSGTIAAVIGSGTAGFAGDGAGATVAQLRSPGGLDVDPSGNVFVADTANGRIRAVGGTPVVQTSGFVPVTATRILDSRYGIGGYSTKWGPAVTRTLKVAGTATVPANATAVVLNVGATRATAVSNLTVWSTGVARPNTSVVNFSPAQPAASSLATVAVGSGGLISIYNAAGSADVVGDITGYYTTAGGGGFTPMTPTRVLDSRDGTGGYSAPWTTANTRNLTVAGQKGVPANAVSVVLNLTAVNGSKPSYVTVYPTGTNRPTVASLNFTAHSVVPNLVSVAVGTNRQITLYNADGVVNLLADVVGYYTASGGMRFTPLTPVRVLNSRSGIGGFSTPWGAGTVRNVTVTGVQGVPSSALAVVLTVTATRPTAASHLTVYNAGVTRPIASNLNFVASQTVANLTLVEPSAGHQLAIYNKAGSVDVIADVAGYFQ